MSFSRGPAYLIESSIGFDSLLLNVFRKKTFQQTVRLFVSWDTDAALLPDPIRTGMRVIHQERTDIHRATMQSEPGQAIEKFLY
jgi:hypothetical protein